MRRWLTLAAVAALSACGSGDEPTIGAPDKTATSTSTVATSTSVAAEDPCTTDYPPFAATWVPEGFSPDVERGSGGTEAVECTVFHWGYPDALGRMIDVRSGDGGQTITPELARTITVLGRPAQIGPIHEGSMVRIDGYALQGYGITEEDLERFAVGLYPRAGTSVEEVAGDDIPDGLYAGRLSDVGSSEVTIDFIGWFSGDEANRVATERGETNVPVPNDHYTVNDDSTLHTLPVDADVVVTSPWVEYGADGCELCQRVIPYERLVELFAGAVPPAPEGNVRHDPFLVTVVDRRVTRLDDQYVP